MMIAMKSNDSVSYPLAPGIGHSADAIRWYCKTYKNHNIRHYSYSCNILAMDPEQVLELLPTVAGLQYV